MCTEHSLTTSESISVTRLVINGAHGKMGTRLVALAGADARFRIAATIGRAGVIDGEDALAQRAFDVVVDVSSDDGARSALDRAQDASSAILLATTALSAHTLERARIVSRTVAVMIAPNTSPGIAVLKQLLTTAAALLPDGYDISLIEHHHAGKRDAPSGTAKALVQALESAGKSSEKIFKNIAAIRAGDTIGEHSARFSGPGEIIELTHRATTRDLFVRGALDIARWLTHEKAGMYTIENMLGLTPDDPLE
ncbi:MAG: 4-hydroxy-tetrahydrodipicolinate reductase [Phycisphaerales bacterium]